jgi:hypothetical protein
VDPVAAMVRPVAGHVQHGEARPTIRQRVTTPDFG